MDRQEINEELKDLCDRIDRITKMYGEKPRGYKDIIRGQYRQLKRDLRTERDKIDTGRWKEQASQDEMNFYYPAITQAYSELHVRSGSPPSEEMIDNLGRAECDISFFLNELKKLKS